LFETNDGRLCFMFHTHPKNVFDIYSIKYHKQSTSFSICICVLAFIHWISLSWCLTNQFSPRAMISILKFLRKISDPSQIGRFSFYLSFLFSLLFFLLFFEMIKWSLIYLKLMINVCWIYPEFRCYQIKQFRNLDSHSAVFVFRSSCDGFLHELRRSRRRGYRMFTLSASKNALLLSQVPAWFHFEEQSQSSLQIWVWSRAQVQVSLLRIA